jgi:hypothetical protein
MDDDPLLHHRQMKDRTPMRAAHGYCGPDHPACSHSNERHPLRRLRGLRLAHAAPADRAALQPCGCCNLLKTLLRVRQSPRVHSRHRKERRAAAWNCWVPCCRSTVSRMAAGRSTLRPGALLRAWTALAHCRRTSVGRVANQRNLGGFQSREFCEPSRGTQFAGIVAAGIMRTCKFDFRQEWRKSGFLHGHASPSLSGRAVAATSQPWIDDLQPAFGEVIDPVRC